MIWAISKIEVSRKDKEKNDEDNKALSEKFDTK